MPSRHSSAVTVSLLLTTVEKSHSILDELHDQNAREAWKRLHDEIIPKFAKYLNDYEPAPEEFQLIAELHYEGINVRCLGSVFDNVNADSLWKVLSLTGNVLIT